MAASVTVFFIYTAELLPTVLRYGPGGQGPWGCGEGRTITRGIAAAKTGHSPGDKHHAKWFAWITAFNPLKKISHTPSLALFQT